jgi:hypothetical protein
MMAECGAKCQPRGLIVILVPFTKAHAPKDLLHLASNDDRAVAASPIRKPILIRGFVG